MTARYLDVDATAERLSMSPDAVRRLVKLRRIPFIKVPGGRSLRFDIQDLDMWMRTGRVEAS